MRAIAVNVIVVLALLLATALVSTGPHWVVRETIAGSSVLVFTIVVLCLPRSRRWRGVLPALVTYDVILTVLLVSYALGIRPDM